MATRRREWPVRGRAGMLLCAIRICPPPPRDRLPTDPMAALQIDQLAGLLALGDGRAGEGLAQLRQAAEAEAELPFMFGPPVAVKPSHELLGEALAEAGRRDEAAAAFREALERTPGRRLAVDGLEAVEGE